MQCEWSRRTIEASTDDARESGRKSGNFWVGRLMRDAFWRMKPAQ
jgi:hypothetical protein